MHNLAEHLFNSRFPVSLRKRREEICQGMSDLNSKFENNKDPQPDPFIKMEIYHMEELIAEL